MWLVQEDFLKVSSWVQVEATAEYKSSVYSHNYRLSKWHYHFWSNQVGRYGSVLRHFIVVLWAGIHTKIPLIFRISSGSWARQREPAKLFVWASIIYNWHKVGRHLLAQIRWLMWGIQELVLFSIMWTSSSWQRELTWGVHELPCHSWPTQPSCVDHWQAFTSATRARGGVDFCRKRAQRFREAKKPLQRCTVFL